MRLWAGAEGDEEAVTLVRWMATVFVMALGGLLVLSALGGIGAVHPNANLWVFVIGALLLMAGVVNRPRNRD